MSWIEGKHDSIEWFGSFFSLFAFLTFAIDIELWYLFVVIHQSSNFVYIKTLHPKIKPPRGFIIHFQKILSFNHLYRRFVQISQLITAMFLLVIDDQHLAIFWLQIKYFRFRRLVIVHCFNRLLKIFEICCVGLLFERFNFTFSLRMVL